MRLCYLLLSPTFGMHQYTADLANRAAAGVFGEGATDIHLVTMTTLAHDRYAPQLHIHTPVTTNGTGFSREGARWGDLRRARAALLDLQPDLVHITGVHAWNVPLVWSLRRRGIPVLHTLHDLDPHSGVRFPALIRLWNRLIVSSVDHLLVHGDRYRDQLLAQGVRADRVTSLPLLHLFLSHERTHDLQIVERPHPDGPPVALFFGRIEAYKGADVLLAAWQQVAAQHPAARLILAGPVAPGLALPPLPLGVELRDRRIADDEALALFRAASLLVLPYRDATQSALVAAAYYFGLPVLVTRTGALPEYVLEGETGGVVPPGDPGALAAALTQALADPSRLWRMGRAGQDWYRSHRACEEQTLAALYARLGHA